MRETRLSGSEGGAGFNPPFLPLSDRFAPTLKETIPVALLSPVMTKA